MAKRRAEDATSWEWLGPGGVWKAYDDADSGLLDRLSSAVGDGGKASSKALSFAAGTLYEFDFGGWTQKNSSSGRVRKIRRVAGGAAGAGPPLKKARSSGDLAFTELLAAEAEDPEVPKAPMAPKAPKEALAPKEPDVPKDAVGEKAETEPVAAVGAGPKVGVEAKAKSSWSMDSKIKDPPPLDVADIKKQASLGSQSKRGWKKVSFGPAIGKNKHATHCFEKMLENEQRNCGEWATFYHSYNHAALIYEVQAAIAAVLFRFKSAYAPLPRLMRGCFKDIPDAPSMMAEFPTWPDQDHNPRFKSVGICATTSLLAADPEASPTACFLGGYAVGALSLGIIEGLLTDCGILAAQAKKLARQIVDLAEKYGLHVGAFGGKASKSGLSGHLVQIFMKRHLVDKYVYASFPMGVPDETRHPIGEHLMTCGKPHICGQVRIVVHPSAFLQASKVRMFVYSADEDFHKNRTTFQELITALLNPVLGSREARITAAKGIFGGDLPGWFQPEDQRDASKAAPKKLATADWK